MDSRLVHVLVRRPVVVAVSVHCRNEADMICVSNEPQVCLHGKHSLSVVQCTVDGRVCTVVRMLTLVLTVGVVLVEHNSDVVLSFALQPVAVSTLAGSL